MPAAREVPFALVVEDHPLVASSLVDCIRECDAGLEVETADSLAAALHVLARRPSPLLIVTDLTLTDSNGIEAVRCLREVAPGSPLLVVTALDDPMLRTEAKALGAQGYLIKKTAVDTLRKEICAVIGGVCTRKSIAPARSGTRRDPLTPKQIAVVEELAAGRSNKEIAVRLGISDETVASHMKEILGRLGATNRTEAVVRYFEMTHRQHERAKS